jgi:hypothetical protein
VYPVAFVNGRVLTENRFQEALQVQATSGLQIFVELWTLSHYIIA